MENNVTMEQTTTIGSQKVLEKYGEDPNNQRF